MGSYTQYVKIIPNSSKVLWVRRLPLIPHSLNQILIMGSCELNGKHDIFMAKGKRNVYLYGGHDPEDFQHQVGSANGLGFTP
jgi:hypothetical protein